MYYAINACYYILYGIHITVRLKNLQLFHVDTEIRYMESKVFGLRIEI